MARRKVLIMTFWKTTLLLIIIGTWILELIVESLNMRNTGSEPPLEFSDVYDDEHFSKAKRYLRENTVFGLARSTMHTLLILAAIQCGWFDSLHQLCCRWIESPILRALPFWGIVAVAMAVTNLPFSIYRTFCIEERFGFNKTTWHTFVGDRIKAMAIGSILGSALLMAIVWFFGQFELAWVYAWGFMVAFQFALMFLAPAVIMPLFNTFEPLEDGELKDAVTAYADRQGFQLRGIYTMDGSKRSSKANAFFTGFGRFRRIVLFDTLVRSHTTDELVAVLAHEMGHFKKRHIPITMGIGMLTLGVMLFLVSKILTVPEIYSAFGMTGNSTPTYAGLLFAMTLFGPLDLVLSITGNWLSRRFEYQADRYAMETVPGGGPNLAEALKKMTTEALGNLTPHPLKVFMEYSHPPVVERIRAMRRNSDQAHASTETPSPMV